MSPEDSKERGLFDRRVPVRWMVLTLALLLLIMIVVVVTLLLVDRREDARREAAVAATSTTVFSSPYDFSELPAGTDLDVVENAVFVSIFKPNEDGRPTGYGISSERPAALALIEAVLHADEVDPNDTPETAASSAGPTADETAVPTITFVFADRGTLTFTLDLQHALIMRGERAWRPEGDLRVLVETATTGR